MAIKNNVFLLIFIFLIISCSVQNNKEYEKIEYYIDSIDIDTITFIGYHPKNESSSLNQYIGYKGVDYAYYVDYLIQHPDIEIDSIKSLLSKEYEFQALQCTGIIIHTEPHRVKDLDYDTLTYNEIKEIKRTDSEWWGKNKHLSRKELLHAYKENPILQDPYQWW